MQIVGDRLIQWTGACIEFDDKDKFGRSAFNRYYYAAFLLTREMLGEFDASWQRTAHSEIPNLLNTGVKKKIANSLKNAEKKGLISASRKSEMLTQVKRALQELASLLTEAYEVRVVADYEPEEVLEVNGSSIFLRRYNADTACNWSRRASAYCKTIRRIWSEAGLG